MTVEHKSLDLVQEKSRSLESIRSTSDPVTDEIRSELVAEVVDDELSLHKIRPERKINNYLSGLRCDSKQERPKRRIIRFKPAYLMSCSGILGSLAVMLLLLITILTCIERNCSWKPGIVDGQFVNTTQNTQNTSSMTSHDDEILIGPGSCVHATLLLYTSFVSACLVIAHELMYVFRIVIAWRQIAWQLMDAIFFAILFVLLFVLGILNCFYESSLLVAAGSLSLLTSIIFLLLFSNKASRHWRRLPVQVYDDEDDFFRLPRKLKFQQINANIKRYWLL